MRMRAQVDIYAFGMCMLEMITKERPYSECNNAAQVSITAVDYFSADNRLSTCTVSLHKSICMRLQESELSCL